MTLRELVSRITGASPFNPAYSASGAVAHFSLDYIRHGGRRQDITWTAGNAAAIQYRSARGGLNAAYLDGHVEFTNAREALNLHKQGRSGGGTRFLNQN